MIANRACSECWARTKSRRGFPVALWGRRPTCVWNANGVEPRHFLITVDSRYCGHPRGEDLVSVIARVRNSGVREETFVFSLNLRNDMEKSRSIVVSTVLYFFIYNYGQ